MKDIAIAAAEKFLLMNEVSERTRIPIDSLRYLRQTGGGPPSFRLGRRVVYPESGLQAWIRAQAEQEEARSRGGDAA
jgi:predicted DNA-binding transcriptional regulator AlpA